MRSASTGSSVATSAPRSALRDGAAGERRGRHHQRPLRHALAQARHAAARPSAPRRPTRSAARSAARAVAAPPPARGPRRSPAPVAVAAPRSATATPAAPAARRGRRARRSRGTRAAPRRRDGARGAGSVQRSAAIDARHRLAHAATAGSTDCGERVQAPLELAAAVLELLGAGVRRHFERLAELDAARARTAAGSIKPIPAAQPQRRESPRTRSGRSGCRPPWRDARRRAWRRSADRAARRADGEVVAVAIGIDQAQKAADCAARRRAAHRLHAPGGEQIGGDLAVAMLADHDAHRLTVGDQRQHQQPVVPKGDDRLLAARPAGAQRLGADRIDAQRPAAAGAAGRAAAAEPGAASGLR